MTKHVFPQGALEMLIMKVLSNGSHHGWGIAQRIHLLSSEALTVEEGSLYPTLSRMQQRGRIKGKLGLSENNRQAKYYTLTALGKMHLKNEQERWESMASAIAQVLQSQS
ncbi:MAG: PadR family transcriptional regulator [Opitutaceae bacterium]|nr:PadR family transcriptional regulator [Opitutaceae bacterium]